MKNLKDKTFGKLKVEKLVRRDPDGKYIWLCRCECGKEREVWGRLLTRGKTTSCNSKECRKHRHRKGNKYELFDDFAIGYDAKGNEFYIDIDDYNEVSKHTWSMTPYGYFMAYINNGEWPTRCVFLHRFVLGLKDPNLVTDHLNHCRHDCRKSNLQAMSQSDNSKNVIRPDGQGGHNTDKYIAAIKKFVIREHPEFGEFSTMKEASDFYQKWLIGQINIRQK